MSVIALYVYDATTFTIDQNIEPLRGAPIDAGEVTLQRGIYRLAGDATITAIAVPKGESSYSITTLTKTDPPDPPLSPMAGYTMSEIQAFLSGAGAENEI